jgi:hypothetical protein
MEEKIFYLVVTTATLTGLPSLIACSNEEDARGSYRTLTEAPGRHALVRCQVIAGDCNMREAAGTLLPIDSLEHGEHMARVLEDLGIR